MLDEKTKKRLALIFIIALLARIAFVGGNAFFRDEALYAEIIDEMGRGSGMIPQYASTPVPWKPPLAFWVYFAFTRAIGPPLGAVGVPIEAIYRLPGVLIGALCPLLVLLIVLEITKNEDLAFVSGIAYAGNALPIVISRTFLTDTLLAFLSLASILLYLYSDKKNRLAIAGGALVFLAIFTKTLMGLIPIALILAYFFLYRRDSLTKKEFLASLLFIPLAFLLLYAITPGFSQMSVVDSTKRLGNTPEQIGYLVGSNTSFLIMLSVPWLPVALYGAFKYRKEIPKSFFFLAWFVLGLAPIISLGPIPWYFLPIICPISVFSAAVVLAGGKADWLSMGVASALIVMALLVSYNYVSQMSSVAGLEESRVIGGSLAGRDALIFTWYNPTMLYYRYSADPDYGTLDVYFPKNESILSFAEVEALLFNSTIPENSITVQDAITISPAVQDRTYLGSFSYPKKTLVVEKTYYWAYMENRTEFSVFSKEKEYEYFVILERE